MNNDEIKLNSTLSEAIEDLEIFVKLASSEAQTTYLEFRADLTEIYSVLLRLWHELGFQSTLKKRQRKCLVFRQAIIESLVECSYRKEQISEDSLPEWGQVTQEEALRKEIVVILGNLVRKLREVQLELDMPTSRSSASFFFVADE